MSEDKSKLLDLLGFLINSIEQYSKTENQGLRSDVKTARERIRAAIIYVKARIADIESDWKERDK